MSKMKSMLHIAAMMSAIAYGGELGTTTHRRERRINNDLLPKEPIQPKGTKEYFFNIEGDFSIEQMRKDECVFKCFAINDKNAKKKFDKFKKEVK